MRLVTKLSWKPSDLAEVAVKPRVGEWTELFDMLTGNINLRKLKTSQTQSIPLDAKLEV